MIVRILGEGQLGVPEADVEALNDLDEALVDAVEGGDAAAFADALARLLEGVRTRGRQLAADYLGPSDLVLPGPDATVEEVRGLLGDEGLIPG